MAAKPAEVIRFIGRSSKRVAVTALGAVLVLGGLVLLVLPGPGFLVVILGFAVLGTEYAWAAAALQRTKRAVEGAGRAARNVAGKAARGTAGVARKATRRKD
ncbi:MAG TPA: PGPGW domain-containing protein [Acidimicrobiales bacterium]|nr:PGPGW domain-containing protein [Acidimicrobiales bacterium]